MAEHYESPNEARTKSLLEGARAKKAPDGRWHLSEGVRVQTFRLDGQSDLVMTAPECFYDDVLHSASSASPMQAQLADGSFSIAGEGFLWQQTNSSLSISNHVHTTIRPKAPTPESGKSAGEALTPGAQALDIDSQSFSFTNSSGLAVYRDSVRVAGTNLNLTCEQLVADIPANDRQLKSLVAERDVAIDYTNATAIHTTSDRAVYSAGTGLIELTGHPLWRADQREGRGDQLIIDRTNRIFQANGRAWLSMPTQGAGELGFLSRSNQVATGSGGTTNHSIEVWSDSYEFRTNWAVFRNNVRLVEFLGSQARGKMTCGRMTAFFGASNQLQTLVAQEHVLIEGETNRMTGGRAVYTATNGWMDLTEDPAWKSGDREGNGKLVRVANQGDALLVRGEARLRMPAKEFGNLEAPGTAAAPKLAARKAMTAESAEVTCNEYTLRPDNALFDGNVRVKHPQMNWACQRMRVRSLPGDGKVLVADGGVAFDILGEKGKVHGVGDNVVYTNIITASFTNDVMYLRGNPATLETTNMVVDNGIIILDRAKNIISAPGGEYRIKGTAKEMSTNTFRLPKSGGKK